MNSKTRKLIYKSVTFGIVILAFILCSVFYKGMSRSLRGQLIPICCWIVMAVSLNLVVGISGELSLGHAGFMSIGAFSGIVISGWLLNGFGMENEILRLILAILAGGVMAGIFGVLIGIPVLRFNLFFFIAPPSHHTFSRIGLPSRPVGLNSSMIISTANTSALGV